MTEKYYTTDFYTDILLQIREGKYWFAVEDKVKREYPYPDKILEFLNTEHIPLGYNPKERFIFHRTSTCDFLPLYPLFPDEDMARDQIDELISFYAYLHKREFTRELKKRGKVALLSNVMEGALQLARAEGWEKIIAIFTIEEGGFEKTEINFVGSLGNIEDNLKNNPNFQYFIDTYEDIRKRIELEDMNTIYFEPYLDDIPEIKGYAYLRRLA